MHARVSYFEGSPDTVEAGLRYLRETVAPAVEGITGNRGLISLLDRETGKSMGITLWESEEAMRASEEEADRMREETAEAAGERIEAVERYEVVFLEVQQ